MHACTLRSFKRSLFTVINVYLLFAVVDLTGCAEEQILNCNQPDMDDCVVGENPDEEPVAMIEESPSGKKQF
jgi:hypothetical protein